MSPKAADRGFLNGLPPPPETELDLASTLREIETKMTKLMNAGLTKKAVLVLIAHETKLGESTIEKVLKAATSLSKYTVKR